MLGLFRDGLRGDMAAISVRVQARNRLFVELREEDVGDRMVDRPRCRFKQIGEANVEAAFTEPNGRVERGEAPEADVECRDRRTGTKFAVLLLEDGDE